MKDESILTQPRHGDCILPHVAQFVPSDEERDRIRDAWNGRRYQLERRSPISFADTANPLLCSSEILYDLKRIFGAPIQDAQTERGVSAFFPLNVAFGRLFILCNNKTHLASWLFCKRREPEDFTIHDSYCRGGVDVSTPYIEQIAFTILREGLLLEDGVISIAFRADPYIRTSPSLNKIMAEIQAERLRGANPPAEKKIARPII